MSNIHCYVTQMADKCLKVVNSCERTATTNDCEVTLLLMAASTGVIVPYERLNINTKFSQPMNDFAHYPEDVGKMQNLLSQAFLTSDIWSIKSNSWKTGELTCLMDAKNKQKLSKDNWPHPRTWPELSNPQFMDGTVIVREVVECMRNALAHGNIYTRPDSANHIETLVFATGTGSEPSTNARGDSTNGNPFRFVSVSVPDFRQFLINWLTWLKKLPMGEKHFPEQEADYILLSAA